MGTRWRRWWPILKVVIAAVVVTAVGWSFARDLSNPALWQRSFQPAWLLACAVLYLIGLGCWCLYWGRLLVRLGQQPQIPALIRAYYVSHLGKYVPGKAWTLFLRAGLASSPTVRPGLAGMTAFYEVVTTMASGAIIAALLLACYGREESAGVDWQGLWAVVTVQPPELFVLGRWTSVALALSLLAVVGIPLLPPMFNRLAEKLSQPFRGKDPAPLPRITTPALLEGLAITGLGWLFLAASFWAALQAITDGRLATSPELLARTTAALGIAYVAAFVLLFAPGGLGVREYLLTLLLVPELAAALSLEHDEARSLVVLTVLGLRLTWTAAEIVTAACVWWLPT
jgi:glycosyltransferase 2 family protein